jgi:hypothetical protein
MIRIFLYIHKTLQMQKPNLSTKDKSVELMSIVWTMLYVIILLEIYVAVKQVLQLLTDYVVSL